VKCFFVLLCSSVWSLVAFAGHKGSVRIFCTAVSEMEFHPPKGFKINLDGPWSASVVSGELKMERKIQLEKDMAKLQVSRDCDQKLKYEVSAYYCNGDNCIMNSEKGEL
jgi:hypothetical protein